MYYAYVLTTESRKALLRRFNPRYSRVIAHHITYWFNPPADEPLPNNTDAIRAIGYVDSRDGIEAVIVSINGNIISPDNRIFHITLSLDPTKYSPKDSNALIARKTVTTVSPSVLLNTVVEQLK